MPNRKPDIPQRTARPLPTAYSSAPDLVDPRWIAKAFGIVLLFALLCSYLLIVVTFHYTQWQLVLKPSRDLPATPATAGLPFDDVRFGVDATGQPQLDGWWVPSGETLSANPPTVLMLHGGSGSMSDALDRATALHGLGFNLLLFDYRGFGHSGGPHPTQALMQADAASALDYLANTRHVPTARVIVYGSGLGAALAVHLAATHPQLPAIVLDAPDGDTEARVRRDTRTRLVPVRLLYHEAFPLAEPLRSLATPKLILSYPHANPTEVPERALAAAASPKMTVELTSPQDRQAFTEAVRRFLDMYAKP